MKISKKFLEQMQRVDQIARECGYRPVRDCNESGGYSTFRFYVHDSDQKKGMIIAQVFRNGGWAWYRSITGIDL